MTVMYLGPELTGIVRKNQIYTYLPEQVIEKACRVHPQAKRLFVPMEDVVRAKSELRRRGSLLYLIYQKMEGKNGSRL